MNRKQYQWKNICFAWVFIIFYISIHVVILIKLVQIFLNLNLAYDFSSYDIWFHGTISTISVVILTDITFTLKTLAWIIMSVKIMIIVALGSVNNKVRCNRLKWLPPFHDSPWEMTEMTRLKWLPGESFRPRLKWLPYTVLHCTCHVRLWSNPNPNLTLTLT